MANVKEKVIKDLGYGMYTLDSGTTVVVCGDESADEAYLCEVTFPNRKLTVGRVLGKLLLNECDRDEQEHVLFMVYTTDDKRYQETWEKHDVRKTRNYKQSTNFLRQQISGLDTDRALAIVQDLREHIASGSRLLACDDIIAELEGKIHGLSR